MIYDRRATASAAAWITPVATLPMWVAFYLFGIQCALAAAGLGIVRAGRAGSGRCTAVPASRWKYPCWLVIGWLGLTLAVAAMIGMRTRFPRWPTSLPALATGLAWLGWTAALVRGSWRRSDPSPGWGVVFGLAAGAAICGSSSAVGLGSRLWDEAGRLGVSLATASASISAGLLAGALTLGVIGYWAGTALRLPGHWRLCQCGIPPSRWAWAIVAALMLRALVIALSLWAGWHEHPIGGAFFVRSLWRGGANLIVLRWMLGVVLPLGLATTLWIDAREARARAVRLQLVPMLMLTALGEWLGCALVTATGGLAI